MASSSSSCSSQPWKYDVFLSFRGEDTRKTFVGHLYDALDRNGIYTYKDDITLPRGETIAPALLTAIEESRFAVVVFSNKYADSSWCLDELVNIMKCKKEKGQTVLPVFYDVDPSDVRKQKGVFGEAFSQKESDSRSGVWRDALVEAANISGWEPKYTANGDESKCIKEIVETISLGLCPIISRVNEDLVGIEPRIQDVKSLLEVGSGGVRMIGICGIGGGGKTTVASAVYNEISNKFGSCSFVENIREDSSKLGLKALQENILSDVLKEKGMKLSGVEEGKSMIRNRLCRKSVLLILDDVNDICQLEALAGSCNWFGEGSRIIITTRDEHLLKVHHVNATYNVNLLKDEEAIQLFSRHAFGANRPIKEFEELSLSVVGYAAGLPLALKVLGSFLSDKDKNEWVSVMARLKDIPESGILEKLKISFDGLQPDEKEIFLDIACFYRGMEKDGVMLILDACGFHPVRGVRVLVQKSLITISDGKFDMHDLMQEMGHNIVQGKHPNNPEKHSRVWQTEKVLQICTTDEAKGNHATEALKYEGDWRHFRKALANNKNLRLLEASVSDESMFLSTKMKLFDFWSLSMHLPNLKVFNLSRSYYIKSTPDFSGLPNLEKLSLNHCLGLVKIHPSIGFLERLVSLDIIECCALEKFPPIVKMRSLKSLNLSCFFYLSKFPKILGNMDSLTHLSVADCPIEVVPSSVGEYTPNLVTIHMNKCYNLRRFEGSFSFLKQLKHLSLIACYRLEKLPKDLHHAECLEYLLITNNSVFKLNHEILFGSGFHHWSMLRKLDLRANWLEDGNLTADIGELSNLIELDLSENGFSQLPSGISRLTRLKLLNVSKCNKLQELPVLPSSIAILIADDCTSLGRVADLPEKCEWLCYFSLTNCSKSWEDKHHAIFAERVLQSMLQGNAVTNHSFSFRLPGSKVPEGGLVQVLFKGVASAMVLPPNWYEKYSGFVVCGVFKRMVSSWLFEIDIHQWSTIGNNQTDDDDDDDNEDNDDDGDDDDGHIWLGYISFSSLKFTKWLKSVSNTLTFYSRHGDLVSLGVGLVDKERDSEPKREAQITSDCSRFSDDKVLQVTHWDTNDNICVKFKTNFDDCSWGLGAN